MAKKKPYKQTHAGMLPNGNSWWHTSEGGGYWHGWMPDHATPAQIYVACMTTMQDLLKNHPELKIQIQDRLKF